MARVDFPKLLKQLLDESELQAPIRALADQAGKILADNKLPFFPDYTDHGTDHIGRVLKGEAELVPREVWENSTQDSNPRVLCDVDAVVIIGATLLHDIAMHVRERGFLQLVGRDTRFRPLPWFNENRLGHTADRPWPELWQDYIREARRFSERQLANVIGEKEALHWRFSKLPENTGSWERNHYLIVGEFIRRHHARLAHEIAIFGFPGVPTGMGEDAFPAMGQEKGHPLNQLADLIGLTARSHGISLRLCEAYLDWDSNYNGMPRPRGTAVLYAMALLRVADYLQIDRQRAPAVLLQLRDPQSPISVREWAKHRAVHHVGPADYPRGKVIKVSPNVSLPIYLQLRELLKGLQEELDHSTAVLDQAYGLEKDSGLYQLKLAIRRVHSNLDSPTFRDGLPYVAERTGFSTDPNLLSLLVEPLYGNKPEVGVRELIQNSVDAVRELGVWLEAHGTSNSSLDLPDQDADVLIDYIERDDGTWLLRATDKGIGMTADTLQNHFLSAGASFRRSGEWASEFLNEDGKPRLARSGRFGVGAFAIFLLGPRFRLWTRHASGDKSTGYFLDASIDSQLIEIRREEGLRVGTRIEVEINVDAAESVDSWAKRLDWFCWESPAVRQRVFGKREIRILPQEYTFAVNRLPPEWSVIYPDGFGDVHWTYSDAPRIECNGIKISDGYTGNDQDVPWDESLGLLAPKIGVVDLEGNLPLTVQRYELSSNTLPFLGELERDVVLSFLAHALVCGPTTLLEAYDVNLDTR